MSSTPTTDEPLVLQRVETFLLPKVFAEIHQELVDCLDHSGGWSTVEDVFNAAASGQSALYRGTVGDKYAGFLVLEPVETRRGWYMNIPFAHTNPSFWGERPLFREAVEQVEAECSKLGFKGVMLTTKRKGAERRFKSLDGYEPDIMRYVKEF